MGTETERKYLVLNYSWRYSTLSKFDIRQKCILRSLDGSVARIRLCTTGAATGKALLTVKGAPSADNLTRAEFEYEVPWADGIEMYDAFKGGGIVKTRNIVVHSSFTLEVDEFLGGNAGLVVAEIEFKNLAFMEAWAKTEKPAWLGDEVTQDKRYANANLENNPWLGWGKP